MNSFWYETLPVNQSAFVQYNTSTNRPRSEFGQQENHGCISNVNTMNMNKRMIEFWKRICPRRIGNGTEQELERERCYRHMMCERMRREKQKQSYSALHSVLPIGTKVKSCVKIFFFGFLVFLFFLFLDSFSCFCLYFVAER